MPKYSIAVILLCLSSALIFSLYKNKSNPNSAYTKALFRIKSIRFFPVISLTYAFFAVMILFCGLFIADTVSGHEQQYHEMLVTNMMCYEKFNTGLDYPLMAIKGRERTINKERPKILVLGDSFVWGSSLTNANQIWWNVMASELERRGYNCEVYAAGFPGANTIDEFFWLYNTALLEDIEPDLIVIGYVINDHGKELPFDIYDPSFWDSAESLIQTWSAHKRPNAVFPNLYDRMIEQIMDESPDWGFASQSTESSDFADYDYVLQYLGKYVQELGIPLAVIPTPEAPRKELDNFYQIIIPLFEGAGMPVFNPLDDFIRQYPNHNNRYFMATQVDPHPGPATSWFLGKYAADIVEQEYTSILGEKREEKKARFIEINDWLPFMLNPQTIQENSDVSQYVFQYPAQSSIAAFEQYTHGNFLSFAGTDRIKKHVKLNFKYPVKLSSIKIEGVDLLSAEVYALALNLKLGFDDQKPVSLGKRWGPKCTWKDKGDRYVTSLLISAKTKDGKQAPLVITIESDGGEEAFY